jgi:NADH dehydrogenase [ubiquinone] 1 alpha subcomplex assembly factor 6
MVRRHDRDRFLTTLFAPPGRRAALLALFAFNYEVAKTREVVSEAALGEIRLQWWRETLAAIYAGAPVRRHEVAEPLAAAIRDHDLTRAHLDAIIDARALDLANEPPPSLAALDAYAEASSSRLLLLALEVLAVRSEAARAAAQAAGVAFALVGLLRAVPFQARMKRLSLPRDLCATAGLDIDRQLFELRSTPALRQVARQIAEHAGRRLEESRALARHVPRAALPALLPATLAGADLARLRRAGYDPFERRLAAPDPWRSWRLTLAALIGRY